MNTGPRSGPAAPVPARIPPYLAAAKPPAGPVVGPEPGSSVRPRPFVLTAGRVRATDPEIQLETQVTTCASPPPWAAPVAGLAPELQLIVAMCREPRSVAEISANVPLHLGVTRVLVSDLRATGHLDVHLVDAVNPRDPELILRVIRGLRAIS